MPKLELLTVTEAVLLMLLLGLMLGLLPDCGCRPSTLLMLMSFAYLSFGDGDGDGKGDVGAFANSRFLHKSSDIFLPSLTRLLSLSLSLSLSPSRCLFLYANATVLSTPLRRCVRDVLHIKNINHLA